MCKEVNSKQHVSRASSVRTELKQREKARKYARLAQRPTHQEFSGQWTSRALGRVRHPDTRWELLRRAAAHVLLGSPDHSKGGLMQSHWTAGSWRLASASLLTFAREEAAQIRLGLRRIQASQVIRQG